MKVAIYARYSSEMQNSASTADQVRICRERAAALGWTVTKTYEDAAQSGASDHRPKYQEMMKDAEAGKFDVLMAESQDRLSRDQEHLAALFKKTRFWGVRIYTRSEGDINEMHIGLGGTMSALFLKNLGDKTRRGLEGRVAAGKSAGGISYGYDKVIGLNPDGTSITGERKIIPDEAKIVQRIFTEYAAGKSPRAIAADLNRDGIAAPGKRNWGSSTIQGNRERGTGILNNELYIGRMVWNRLTYLRDPSTGKCVSRPNPECQQTQIEVPHLRIIGDDLWDAVKQQQQQMSRDTSGGPDRQRPETARRTKYLFSGLVKCGCCGASYTLIGNDRYGCAAARNKGTCDNRLTIPRERLEELVLSGLKDNLLHPELVKEFVAEWQREWNRLNAEKHAARDSLQRNLKKVVAGIEGMLDAIQAGMFHPSMKDRLTALETEKKRIEAELQDAEEPNVVSLHHGLGNVYGKKIEQLTALLNREDSKAEAVAHIRELVTEIRMMPQQDGTHEIDIVGRLAGILALISGVSPAKSGAAIGSITLVAGTGFEPVTFRL